MPSKQAPWLAPLIVPPEMKNRLEATWARVSASLGTPMPKTFFVRMLLERGMQSLDASWPIPPTSHSPVPAPEARQASSPVAPERAAEIQAQVRAMTPEERQLLALRTTPAFPGSRLAANSISEGYSLVFEDIRNMKLEDVKEEVMTHLRGLTPERRREFFRLLEVMYPELAVVRERRAARHKATAAKRKSRGAAA